VAEIDRSESDYKSQGCYDFEVDEALDAHAAYALQIAMASNARHQSCEDQGSDDGLDEAQKDVAEDPQADRERRCVEAQLRASHHRDEDPRRQGPPFEREDRQQEDCGTAQGDTDAMQFFALKKPDRHPGRQ
jgi:hypothetical protein